MKSTLETRLGLFFALALVVAAIILQMVGGTDLFHKSYTVYATFNNVQELKKGDPVKMAGVDIGRIEEIELIGGRAKVTMKIQRKYPVKTDSKAVIKFAGLMGQNFVAIEGGTPESPDLQPNNPVPSGASSDLSSLMAKMENVASGIEGLTKSFSAENFSTLLGPLNDFMRQNSTNISAILSNTAQLTFHIAQGEGTVGRLIKDDALYNSALATVSALQVTANQAQGFMNDARGIVSKANSIMDQVQSGQGTVGRLLKDEKLYVQTTSAMDNLSQILEKINRGQGSVGKLINDETLLKNAKLTLQKLDKATEGLEDQGPLSVLGIAVNSLF
jgi:phospholipid/cholesterol/gamma-HCH transport system substrate-binding protein